MKNSYDVRQFLQSKSIPDDHILVSFDVKSLFTSIPQDLALQSAVNAIENDDEFNERTAFSKQSTIKLIKTCIGANQFQFNNKFYKQ